MKTETSYFEPGAYGLIMTRKNLLLATYSKIFSSYSADKQRKLFIGNENRQNWEVELSARED